MAASTNLLRLCLVACLLSNAVAFEPTPTTDSLKGDRATSCCACDVGSMAVHAGDAAQQRAKSAELRMLSHGAAHGETVEGSHEKNLEISPRLVNSDHANQTAVNLTKSGDYDEDHGEHDDFDLDEADKKCLSSTNDTSCSPAEHARIIKSLMPTIFFALSIQMFFIMTMWLLIITKWKDADVRRSVYIMISTTVSIFIAILINKTIFDVFFLQILPCPRLPTGFHLRDPHHHRVPGELCGRAPPEAMIGVCIAFYFVYQALTQGLIICSRPRGCYNHWTKTGYIASSLGAHLKGFAAVGAFGVLQYERTDHVVGQASLVIVLALVFFIGMRLAAWYCPCCGGKSIKEEDEDARGDEPDSIQGGSYTSVGLINTQELVPLEEESEEEWIEMLIESDDDAASLCLGFLIVQALCLQILGFLPPVEEEEFKTITVDQRNLFLKWEGLLLLFFLVIVLVRWCFREAIPYLVNFALKLFQCVLGMTLSWLCFRHCDWFYRQILNDIFNPEVEGVHRKHPPHAVHLAARITNAVHWSAISVVAVILIDVVADAWHKKDCYKALRSFASALNPGFSGFARPAPVSATFKAIDEFKKSVEEEHTEHNPFREVIGALGFLVGVCWEKAFSEATQMLGESFFELAHHVNKAKFGNEHRVLGPFMQMWHSHPMLTKCITATLVVGLVFVTWVKYLVPYAKLDEAEHTYLYYTEGFVCEKMNSRVTRAEADQRPQPNKYALMLHLLHLQSKFAGWRCQQCQGKLEPISNCKECNSVKAKVKHITNGIVKE